MLVIIRMKNDMQKWYLKSLEYEKQIAENEKIINNLENQIENLLKMQKQYESKILSLKSRKEKIKEETEKLNLIEIKTEFEKLGFPCEIK